MPPLPDRTGAATWILLAILLAGALAALAGSMVPLRMLTGALGSMSGSGDAAQVIAERYAGLVFRARVTGCVLLAVWAVLAWQRQWLTQLVGLAANVARKAPNQALNEVRRAWRTERVETTLFLAILLGAFVLRLIYLGRDIRHDEAWTYVVYARRPFYLSPLLMSDVNHHPLNTMLIQLSVALFGNSVWAIRLPAFLFGMGCIPAGYGLARAVWGRGTALIAAAAIAGCSPLVEYSVNARGYSAVACCALLMLWAGFQGVRTGSVSAWTAAVLAGVAGAYANPVMVLPAIVAFAWFVLLLPGYKRPLAAIREIIGTGLALLVGALCLYLPLFTVSGWDVISSSQGIKARAGMAEALATAPTFAITLLENWDRDFSPSLGLIAVLLAALAPILARRHRWVCTAFWGAMALAVLFQFAAVRDSGPERVWLSFLPMLLVLAAAGWDGVIGRFGGGAVMVPGGFALLLGGLMAGGVVRSGTLLSSVETGYFPAAHQVAHDLVSRAPGDLLAITAVRGDEVMYYAMREGLLMTPVREAWPLRLYRPLREQPDGWLLLVVDKVLELCPVEACLNIAQTAVPTVGQPQLWHDDPAYTEMRLQRAER